MNKHFLHATLLPILKFLISIYQWDSWTFNSKFSYHELNSKSIVKGQCIPTHSILHLELMKCQTCSTQNWFSYQCNVKVHRHYLKTHALSHIELMHTHQSGITSNSDIIFCLLLYLHGKSIKSSVWFYLFKYAVTLKYHI